MVRGRDCSRHAEQSNPALKADFGAQDSGPIVVVWARGRESAEPSAEDGLPYDDARLGLPWPLSVTAISGRDRSFRPLDEIEGELKLRMSLA